ncbi:MAG: hypothetical protein ACXABY_06735 [Candidatus Thorarchaeota archaeon]|jgi:RNA polymerase sigma factor (sigma-70 family)
MDNREFSQFFLEKYHSLINKVARKYLIPNRYTTEDIKQYIGERVLQILKNREGKPNKIEDPEKYFKSCLDFYCIEYQRMHGYIFDLPKRPRKNCEEDETYARSLGFKYIGDMTIEETNSLHYNLAHTEENYWSPETPVWSALTGCLTREEANVVECIFLRNMTWAETSEHLGVAQSTCWFRKNRALERIFKRFDDMTGQSIVENLREVLRGNVDLLTGLNV